MRGPSGPCPRCGGTVLPVVRGYPSFEAFEAYERGEVLLGGCLVGEDDPAERCGACGWAPGGDPAGAPG